MKSQSYNIKKFPGITCNRMILRGIIEMFRLKHIYRARMEMRIKTSNSYVVNVCTKRWKAKKNLDLVNRIWNMIEKFNFNVKFIKVDTKDLKFPNFLLASFLSVGTNQPRMYFNV